MMDLQRIKYAGEFERISVVGQAGVQSRQTGVEIQDQDSFLSNLHKCEEYPKQLIDSCTIYLVGDVNIQDMPQEDINSQRMNHKAYNIRPYVLGINGYDRYIIGFMTVLIYDGQKIGLEKALQNDNLSISMQAKQQDEIEMFEYLNSIAIDAVRHRKQIRLGLLDRMYIAEVFRKNGIGGWFIDNLRDLVSFYSKTRLDELVLETGDFQNESQQKFGMTREQYTDFLKKFYSKHGLKGVNNGLFSQFRQKISSDYMTITYK